MRRHSKHFNHSISINLSNKQGLCLVPLLEERLGEAVLKISTTPPLINLLNKQGLCFGKSPLGGDLEGL
jgi:hypothetical protein